MEGYIYLTTNTINGKQYIGKKTSSKFLGTSYLGSGRYLQNAVKTYGKENFTVELLECVDNKEDLTARELYWIDKYNAVKNEMFYNQTRECSPGRDGINANWDTRKLQSIKAKQRAKTEEGKQNLVKAAKAACSVEGRNVRISETLKQRYSEGLISAYWTGKNMSEQAKHKMSESRMGHQTSESTKSKISEANKGRIYICKEGVTKSVKPENLSNYLDSGWVRKKKV